MRLLAYWRGKCGANSIPSRDDLRPTEMKPLLERLSIWERCANGEDNRIRLIGTLATEIFEKDPSGRLISEAYPRRWADLFNRSNDRLYDEMRPLYISYDLAQMGREHVVIEQLVLPLRRSGTVAELSIHVFARMPPAIDEPISSQAL